MNINAFKFLLPIFIVGLVAGKSSAQVVFQSLDDAFEFADLHQTDLQIANARQEIATLNQKNTLSSLLPQVKAFGNFDDYVSLPVQLIPAEIFGGQPGEFAEVQFGTQYQLNVGLEASIPLINTMAWNKRKSSGLEAAASNYQQEQVKQQLYEKIARAYYLSLLAKEASRLSLENRKASTAILNVAQSQWDTGLLEKLPLNRMKANDEKANNQLLINQKSEQNNLDVLKNLCGIPLEEDLLLEESLPSTERKLTAESSLDYAILRQPGVLAAEQKIKIAQNELKGINTSFLPQLSAFGRYSQQAWSNNLDFGAYDWYEVAVIGMRLEWTLFSGNKRNNDRGLARNSLAIAEWEKKKFISDKQAEHDELWREYHLSSSLIQSLKRTSQLFDENFQMAQDQYQEGIISTDELLSIQKEMWEAQREYLSGLANYFITSAILSVKSETNLN
ncbi:TolC family protein [Marivirga sp. S37H4]|uniref:TolC family protein n=1 Tax=Marivirga aurantiaca TaxID=2802615 RepID=A0A934WZI5_9BACT|nr:TolC family protein [Marivirga aurantiaca]MBK6266093.1 TolC family protein [Marivirga aurantiaca]